MARTYWAEGRTIANFLRGLFVLAAVYLYYYYFSYLHWIWLFIFAFIGVIWAELIGRLWTKARRAKTKGKKRSVYPTTNQSIKTNKISKQSSSPVDKKELSDEELIWADIDSLSGPDFERLIALYYRDKGYEVQLVGGTGDHGVDIVLKDKDGYKIAIQCKRQKENVRNDVILKLRGGKQIHGCHGAKVITTSNFTPAARKEAEILKIELINGLMVHDMINTWRKAKKSKLNQPYLIKKR